MSFVPSEIELFCCLFRPVVLSVWWLNFTITVFFFSWVYLCPVPCDLPTCCVPYLMVAAQLMPLTLQQVRLRSLDNNGRSYLLVRNNTVHQVRLIWINYSGNEVCSSKLHVQLTLMRLNLLLYILYAGVQPQSMPPLNTLTATEDYTILYVWQVIMYTLVEFTNAWGCEFTYL